MKHKIVLIFALLIFASVTFAQQQLCKEMREVFDACWAMRTAISAGNATSLKSANEDFKRCNVLHFKDLTPEESDIISLNGHFVWNDEFVDSLIKNRKVREYAQKYAELKRQTGKRGAIYVKTYAVKSKGVAKFFFPTTKHQEIAVIAEPRGKISLRMQGMRTKNSSNDDQDVRRGQEYRIRTFDTPKGVSETIELQVINCSKRDISFVVICN